MDTEEGAMSQQYSIEQVPQNLDKIFQEIEQKCFAQSPPKNTIKTFTF